MNLNFHFNAEYFKELGYELEEEVFEDVWLLMTIFGTIAFIALCSAFYLKAN